MHDMLCWVMFSAQAQHSPYDRLLRWVLHKIYLDISKYDSIVNLNIYHCKKFFRRWNVE